MDDQTLAAAVRDIILPLGVIPTSSAQSAHAGDLAVTLTDPADAVQFAVGGSVIFDDDAGEEELTISRITAGVLSIDFAGLEYAGLQYDHAAGALVYSNLFVEAPIQIGAMLARGTPVVFVTAAQEDQVTIGSRRTLATYTVHVQYHRQLVPSTGSPMPPNTWALRQQRAARRDLTTITEAIRTNQRLQTATGPNALGLGREGAAGTPILTKNWRRLTYDLDNQQFVAALDVIVRVPPAGF